MAQANTQRFEVREVEVTKKGAQACGNSKRKNTDLEVVSQDNFLIEVMLH